MSDVALTWKQRRALEYLCAGGNDSASSGDGEAWFFNGALVTRLMPHEVGPMLKCGFIEMDGHKYVLTSAGRAVL